MATTHDDSTELRLEAPNTVVAVFDGVSIAQRLTRNQLVLRVLSDWADARLHEATVLARVVHINPAAPEAAGKGRSST